MRGHIKESGQGSWSIVLSLGYDAEGKRRRQWITFRGTRKDAQKRLTELLHQLDSGSFVSPSKLTTGEFLVRWLKDYKPNLSPRGFERYRDIVEDDIIPALGRMPLTQLKPDHLQKHYTKKLEDGLSAGSVRYHHAVLHVALRTAVKWGLLSRNPADAVSPPKVRSKEMRTWGEDEIARFLESAKDTPYHALFYLALFTGMRRSELLGLRWLDVDLDLIVEQISVTRTLHHLKDGTYVFTEPKSVRSRRTIALPPTAAQVLREHRERQESIKLILGIMPKEDDLVFAHVDGNPLRPNTITRAWADLAARAGVRRIRLHDARHTHASLMLKQGVHPKIVQERLGHSSIQITLDRYSHVAPGLQKAAAQRFDEGLRTVAAGAQEALLQVNFETG